MFRTTCDNCGKIVWKYESQIHPGQELFFCDNDCFHEYSKANYITYDCEVCGSYCRQTEKVFNKSNNHFCSHKCLNEWKLKIPRIEVVCEMCSKKVIKKKNAIGKQTFCSYGCEWGYYKKYGRPGKAKLTEEILKLTKAGKTTREIRKIIGVYPSYLLKKHRERLVLK